MNNFPFVSIIIVSFNGKDYLPTCLSSISNLGYPKENLEVILVDDGSKDKTYEFIKENFRRINIIRNCRNKGAAASRNIGIKYAKGSLIAFLDDDAEVEKNWLAELVKPMIEDIGVGICASKILFGDKREILNSAGGVVNLYGDAWDRGIFEKDKGQYDEERRVFFGCSAGMLVKKEVLKKTGYFDPVLHVYYEDMDLGWRVNLLGYKVMYAPASIVYHRLAGAHKMSNLKRKYLFERNRIRIIIKNYESRTLLKNAWGLLKFKLARFKMHIQSPKQPKLGLFIYALAAWTWNLLYILDTLRKRKYIQTVKIIPDKAIFQLMGSYKYASFNLCE